VTAGNPRVGKVENDRGFLAVGDETNEMPQFKSGLIYLPMF